MTHEPFTQAIGRSAALRLALIRSHGDRPVVAEAPVPRAVQLWIVAMFVACALLTSCASADRADADVSTTSTTEATNASTTSTAAPTTTSASTSTSTTTSTSSTTTAPPTTEPVPESTLPLAPVNPKLAQRIPDVAGFVLTDVPQRDVLWHFYELPAGLTEHHQVIVSEDGSEIGRLVVASATGAVSPIDAYVETAFGEGIQLPQDNAPMPDNRTLVLTTDADVAWAELGYAAVVAATLPDHDSARWAWTSDNLLWVVGGPLAAERYAGALIATQVGDLDPWDQQGMTGDLFLYTPEVPGYTYYDLERVNALAAMPQMLLQDCYERYYAGYVLPADAPVETPPGLYWAIFRVAGSCADNGFVDAIASHVASNGFEQESIAGVDVWRDANNIVALHDDIVIHLSAEPATFDEYGAFVEALFAQQPS